MAYLLKQLRIPSVNGRWIDSLPKEYFCIHIQGSGRCGGSKCFVNYTGSGPHQCANPHCRGHRSSCDPPCLGEPPVMRLCDIEAEKKRRERLNQHVQLLELEQDQRIGPTPRIHSFAQRHNDQANKGVGQQALAPYVPPQLGTSAQRNYAHVPRLAQQSAKSTVQNEEEDVLRRVLALSLDDSQNPPATSSSDEDDALRRILALSLEDTRNTSSAGDTADEDLLEAIRQSQIESTPRTGDQSRELEEVMRLSQLQTGPPSDQDLLAEAIRQSQAENQCREERGNFVTLATMGQRAKQVRLERGEDIESMATETSLRSREYRGDDDFAVTPVRASPAAETQAPAPAAAMNSSSVSTSTSISVTTFTTRHQSNAPVSTTARSLPSHVPAPTTTSTTTEPPKPLPRGTSYDEWMKSVDLAMQQQENNSALGPSPEYSAVALPGERSAEFDANDEVRTWTRGD